MKICNNCKAELDDDMFFCPYCGNEYYEPVSSQHYFTPQAPTKNNKHYLAILIPILAVVFVWFLNLVSNTTKDMSNSARYEKFAKEISDKPKEETKVEAKKETKDDKATNTKETLASFIGKGQAKKVKKILKKKIGFKKVKYISKQDGLNAFDFKCDDKDVVVMAYEDEISTIYACDNQYTLYENGKVKITAKELQDLDISISDIDRYKVIAESIIDQAVTGRTRYKDTFGYKRKGNLVTVQSKVQGKNSFNAWVSEKFTVQFRDYGNFDYEVQYVKLGDDTIGTYIK